MPFAQFAARSFTAVSIQKNAPESSGVYGLFNARECLLIGQSSNIRAELLAELREIDTGLRIENPTGFTVELCSPGERAIRLEKLVRELEPRFRSSGQRRAEIEIQGTTAWPNRDRHPGELRNDLTRDTPRTPMAASRFKRLLAKVGPAAGSVL